MKTPTLRRLPVRALAGAAAAIAAIAAPAQPQRAQSLAGTWELSWRTGQGPWERRYAVIRQNGSEVHARIHGGSGLSAYGNVSGSRFALRGWRLAIPFYVQGRWQGDRLEGSLQTLTATHHFVGRRRRG